MTKLLIACTVAFGLSLGIATGTVISRDSRAVSSASSEADSTAANDSLALVPDSLKPNVAGMLDSTNLLDSLKGVAGAHRAGGEMVSEYTFDPTTAAGSAGKMAVGSASASRTAGETPSDLQQNGLGTKGRTPQSSRGGTMARNDSSENALIARIASIFAAMPTKDAARVLSEMDDADLQRILLSLPRKQQAAILGSLSTERAATIAKATLRDTL